MPNINEMFPSRYVTAADIGDSKPIFTCASVYSEMGENFRTKDPEEQWYMQIQGKEKVVRLNPTSARAIAETYGPETDAWAGQKMQMFTTMQNIGGELKQVLYVKAAPKQLPQVPQQQAPPAPAPAPAPSFESPSNGQPVVAGNTVDGDDDLPF